MLRVTDPEEAGLNRQRWQHTLELIEQLCAANRLSAAGLMVVRNGLTCGVHLCGRQQLQETTASIREDAIFLVASITKPIVGMGALLLVERGQLLLSDRVVDYLPEFGKRGKYAVSIRHLLTHTSGLPDMLPNNQELRMANAPLSAFVEHTCEVGLDYPPGRSVQYQSMGFAILAAVIERISGQSCREFLQENIFQPLGMDSTALGAPDDWFEGDHPTADRLVEIRVPDEQKDAVDWNWNSRYWRQLGAPWGGLLTTPEDLSRFSHAMLTAGRDSNTSPIFAPATVAAATRNQMVSMSDVPEEHRRCRPWGLGWRLNWPAHSANFGDFLGPRTYGHWGATGTVLWIDPDSDTSCAFLTTQPLEPYGADLARVSNSVMAALR